MILHLREDTRYNLPCLLDLTDLKFTLDAPDLLDLPGQIFELPLSKAHLSVENGDRDHRLHASLSAETLLLNSLGGSLRESTLRGSRFCNALPKSSGRRKRVPLQDE
jgi:hypothetical protein